MFYVHKLKEGIVWVGWLKRSLNKLWMFAPQTSNGCSCQAMGVAAKQALIQGRSDKVLQKKVTCRPNECHNIPFILSLHWLSGYLDNYVYM